MSLGILGKKLGMTQVFDEHGNMIPVTVVLAGPCVIVQIKTIESDGYNAIQVGFEEFEKPQRINKPTKGHFTRAKTKAFKVLREFRTDLAGDFKVGQVFDLNKFKKGDILNVSGTTKGRGFQGVIKRHGKAGGPASHGSHFHRGTGSIGMCAEPGRVIKGMKMPGQMGNVKRTIKTLEVADIKLDENLL
jgi:large subunit ribosomal protein L3